MFEGKLVKEVNLEDEPSYSPKASPLLTASLDIKGLDYAWRVLLKTRDQQVADEVRGQLVSIYTMLAGPLAAEAASVRAQMLDMGMAHLLTAAQAMLGISEDPASWRTHVAIVPQEPVGEEYTLAATQAVRCLQLLSTMVNTCQGNTMPARPTHAASSIGQTVTLDVTGTAMPGRVRLQSHSNAYVGQIRREIAALVSTEAPFLRIFHLGAELKNDALLLHDARITDGPVMVSVSPSRNSYTEPTAEARAAMEAASPSVLLAERPGFTDLLLCLADWCYYIPPRTYALSLLDMLPTDLTVLSDLRGACLSEAPSPRLTALLACAGPDGQPIPHPARLMYTLQALISLMFPAIATEARKGASPEVSDARELQNRFVSSGCLSTALRALYINIHHLAGRDPAAIRRLASTALHLITALSREPIAPFCERPAVGDESIAPAEASSTRAEEPQDSAVSMSIEQGEPCSSDTTAAAMSDLPAPPPAPPDEADSGVTILCDLMSFYIFLSQQAGSGWGAFVPHADSFMPDHDSSLSLEALTALELLLHRHPHMLPAFLQDEKAREMAIEALLNPRQEGVRSNAARFLSWIATHPQGQSWLLTTLQQGMSRADAAPGFSQNYYRLFRDAVRAIPHLPNRVPSPAPDRGRAEKAARATLLEMVSTTRSLWAEDEQDCRLEGKLQLLLALVQVLDGSVVGTASGGGLVRRLLTEYLFPEAHLDVVVQSRAVPINRMDPFVVLGNVSPEAKMSKLSQEQLHVVMGTRCGRRETRKAALDLLLELMVKNLDNLKEGVELIQRLHCTSGFVARLADHFGIQPNTNFRARNRFVGLKNAGATCYMNAVFQQLFMQPSIRHLVLMAQEEPRGSRMDSVFYQLQCMFGGLAYSNQESITPYGFWQAFKDYDGEPINVREHQDAYEFFTRLQDLVDQRMREAGEHPAMQTVMGGKFAQQIICRSVNFRSEREEDFYQLSLEVRGKRNLEESLDFYVSGELMEGDNQYYCEEVGKKVDAVKRNCIKVLPHMLVLHLKRFEFDYELMTRSKIKDRFEFPEKVDMYKYTVEGQAEREAAEAASREGSGTTSEPATPKAPPEERAKYMFHLKGIVVHSGTAFAGHYYSYIKDREGKVGVREAGQWYCFDDTTVEPWDIRQLECDCFGGKYVVDMFPDSEYDRPNSAYMLFYEREAGAEPSLQAQTKGEAEQEAVSSAPMAEDEDVVMAALAAPMAEEEEVGAMLASTATAPEGGDVPMATEPTAPEVVMSTAAEAAAPQLPPLGQDANIIAALAAVPVPDISISVPSIFEDVMSDNLRGIQHAHLLDPDYFRFLRHLVEAYPEARVQKARRTDCCSPSKSSASAGSGSGTVLEERGSPSLHSQALHHRSSDEHQQFSLKMLGLAVNFLLKVYLHAHSCLRDDKADWMTAIKTLMDAIPTAPRILLSMLTGSNLQDDDAAEEDVVDIDSSGCMKLLIYCDQEDVRAYVAALFWEALYTVEQSSARAEVGGSPSKAHALDACAVRSSLEALKCWLPARRAGPPSYQLDNMFLLLKSFVELGTRQRNLMYEVNLVGHLLLAASRISETLQRHWCEKTEATFVSAVQLLSPLVCRWDMTKLLTARAVVNVMPNPYLNEDDPPLVFQNGDWWTLLVRDTFIYCCLENTAIIKKEVRQLLQFLMWENQDVTMLFLTEFAKYAKKPGLHQYYRCEGDVAQTCCIRDRYFEPRMCCVMFGHTFKQYSLADCICRPSTDIARYAALKIMINMMLIATQWGVNVRHHMRRDPRLDWRQVCHWVANGGPYRDGVRTLERDPEWALLLINLRQLSHEQAPYQGEDEEDDEEGAADLDSASGSDGSPDRSSNQFASP